MRKIVCLIVSLWALALLAGCGSGEEQRVQLAELERQNRADSVMRNDSLAESLVAYFDRHGTPNERMRAYYMLGRTYFDLGELPRALETYLIAADCADTTSSDCDYKVLSRIHAQSAIIFHSQIQPHSQLRELRLAMHFAKRAKDTLQYVECYSQQTGAYEFLRDVDSIILVCEKASSWFKNINRIDRSAQMRGRAISALVVKGDTRRAKACIDYYERNSELFDAFKNVFHGHEIYYYIKGEYYLSIGQIDSAEYLFRKELSTGKDLNNQIAGHKGLMSVFERKGLADSIAKYANLSYQLNDSAYSLSEMENIQKLQASYNYNHQKTIAEQSKQNAENVHLQLIVVASLATIIIFIGFVSFLYYRYKKTREVSEYRENLVALEKAQSEIQKLCGSEEDIPTLVRGKNEEIKHLQTRILNFQKRQASYDAATLEDRLMNGDITKELISLLEQNPIQVATQLQLRELRRYINEQIPCFYETLNRTTTLRPIEYEVCVLIRFHFKPSAIGKLLGRDDGYIANLRKGILLKVYGLKGTPKDLDERIMRIV